jgi:hypothetical protein
MLDDTGEKGLFGSAVDELCVEMIHLHVQLPEVIGKR